MAGPRMQCGRLATLLLVVVIAIGSAPSAVYAARDRFEPSSGQEATPFAEPLLTPETSDGDVSGDSGASISGGVISAPAVEEGALPQVNVRERPDARKVSLEPTPTPTEKARTGIPRLDDPVLRWLPEIMASAAEAGVPPELIAGVMRLESNGNPNIISPAGARGMMQIMPEGLIGMGIPQSMWHDPATNIRAGAFGLAQRAVAQGSWEGAVAAYFGFGCDVFGTCTEVYIQVAFGWAAFFAPAIADPYNSGYAILPDDWVPPAINPFVEKAPAKVATPPPATPTPVSSATPTATPAPDTGGTPVPTEVPTDVPSEVPSEVPVEIPTEIPTEAPTEIPTEAPVEPPSPVEEPPAASSPAT